MELSTIIEKGLTFASSAGISVVSAYFSLKARIDKIETDFGTHKKDVEKLEELVESLRSKLEDYQKASNATSQSFAKDEELTRFVEGTQAQWQAIQRTLGQIEGTLTALRTTK